MMQRWTASWVWLLVGVAGACSSSVDNASDGAPRGSSNAAGGSSATGDTPNSSSGGSGGSGGLPPEKEESTTYRAPVVSGRWVWTANPATGKVAVVDAKNFTVRLSDAGLAPTYLTGLPSLAGKSRALVINTGSHDASLLSAGDTGDVTAVQGIPLQPDANAWSVSKNGKFALAWTDAQAIAMHDPTQGYQDVTVVDLRTASPISTRLTVGFLPSRVFINDAETKAFIVASSGISVIDLASAAGPSVLKEEAVSKMVPDDPTARDVSVLPDGSYAFVRHEGSPVITLLELESGTLSDVTLPGAVTDLDLVPNAHSVLAVVRGQPVVPPNGDAGAPGEAGATGDAGAAAVTNGGAAGETAAGGSGGTAPVTQSTLAILPIPGIFTAPDSFVSVSVPELFGLVNIAPQGTEALLYTNAVPNSHLTVLQTATGGMDYLLHRTLDLHGLVKEVFPSSDGAYAIAALGPTQAGKNSAFAAVSVEKLLPPRIQTTEAPVFAVAQSDGDSPRAIVTVSDDNAVFAAYVVRMPELVIDRVQLPSRPLLGGTGIVPEAGVAYIAESHPTGRITFIDLETGVPRTITGFEIAAKVVNGN